jgi:DnaJ-class molecular chaperone
MDISDEDNYEYCSNCSGSGLGYSGEDSKCSVCGGSGEVYTGETVEPDEPEYNRDED